MVFVLHLAKGTKMSQEKLKEQFDFYLKHQEEFVQKYNKKAIAIKDFQVIGVYDTEFEAVQKTSEKHEMGTFIVQYVSQGPGAYTVFISPSVVFESV